MTILFRAVLVITGLAIAARAFLGPIHSPVSINSPSNIEGCFALAGVVLVLLAANWSDSPLPPVMRRISSQDLLALAGLLAITLAAFAWTRHDYFLSDDFLLNKHAAAPWTLRALFTTPGGDGFFRPVGYLAYMLSASWAGADPASWHWIGFALHAINSLLVYLLAAALGCSRLPCGLASALFALHGTRPEAVVWMAGRFDLLSTLFVLAALIFFVCSWERNWIYAAAALLCMVAALLTKESAFMFPLAAALLSALFDKAWRKSIPTLALFFLAAAAVFTYRWFLLGGLGGYPYIFAVLPTANAFTLRLWAALLFPINWSIPCEFGLSLLAVAYMFALGLLFPLSVNWRRVVFAIGFTLLAALPPLSQLAIGPDLQKSRILYLPSIGFCLLLAFLLESSRRALAVPLAVVLVAFQFAALEHNLAVWNRVAKAVQSACAAAAHCETRSVQGLPASLDGVYAFANGFTECVAMQQVTPTEKSCVLWWDKTAQQLRASPPP